jgi:hypothetical protein
MIISGPSTTAKFLPALLVVAVGTGTVDLI